MPINYSQLARCEMNKKKRFTIQSIADSIGCDRENISWMTTTLKKQGYIKLFSKSINKKTGCIQATYIRLKKIPPARNKHNENDEIIEIDTKSFWYQFCFNKKTA